MPSSRILPLFCAALILAGAGAARAYTVSSAITSGCHEQITSAALRAVRLEFDTAAPLPADRNDQALIGDLQFTPDADMGDLGGATLLIGVRDNDLKGRSSTDLSQLALVHGDPSAQREHCLRDQHELEPGGSQAALNSCRQFILERVQQALEGLDAAGAPDPTVLTSLPLHLALRQGVDAQLPTYYVRIGQALHALQDSFTHTYRTADGLQITVVLDWLDEANGTLVESLDGPPHEGELDRCDDPDALRTRRHQLAIEASTAVLRATLDARLRPEQKLAAVATVLDQYLSFSPTCTFDNGWCSAVEEGLGNGALSCSTAGVQGRAWLGWAAAFALFALLLRSPRRRLVAKVRARPALLLILALGAGAARAQQPHPSPDAPQTAVPPPVATPPQVPAAAPSQQAAATKERQESPKVTAEGDRIVKTNGPPPPADEHAPPPPITKPTKEPGPADPSQMSFGGYLGISGSIDNGALAGSLGARLRVSTHWTLGLDGEWNPFLAYNGTLVRPGVFNGYATAIFRLPLAYEQFNLRVSGSLGISRLLMDLYGAPNGSTGIYAGFSPLALEWKVSRRFYLIINPLHFALPVPQLKGVPFAYPQYRTTIGIEVYTG